MTWQRTSLRQCGLITGLDFLNSTHGWAFISNNLSKSIVSTVDGGEHWRYVGTLPIRASIDFSSSENGWATAISGDTAYATSNGGVTWHALALPIPNFDHVSVVTLTPPKFFGTKFGVIGAEMDDDSKSTAAVFETTDGGKRWTASVLPDHVFDAKGIVVGQLPTIEPFVAVGPKTWIFYLGPKLYETSNGGRTWFSFLPKSPLLENATTSLDFVTSSNGWAIQWSGDAALAFLRTATGGRTWKALANVSGE